MGISRNLAWRVALLVGLLALPLTAVPATAQTSDFELALRWAPIHYQDTDSSDYDADYLSAVDFDGEWNTLNNWEHQDDSIRRLTGKVYYSVVDTTTHWFIVYGFYHPRDWSDVPDPFNQLEHENDMEGVLLTVRKGGSKFGQLEAMVSVFHLDFYSFIPRGSAYTSGREDIDGRVILRPYGGIARPTTRQEAKGHGVKAWDGKAFPGDDGVVYYPDRRTAEAPASGNDRFVRYRLVNIFAAGGLWARRHNAQTFASFGTFRGDNGKDNAANAPWGWDDHDDGENLLRGVIARDPAKLVAIYFGNEGVFSRTYLRNGYRRS